MRIVACRSVDYIRRRVTQYRDTLTIGHSVRPLAVRATSAMPERQLNTIKVDPFADAVHYELNCLILIDNNGFVHTIEWYSAHVTELLALVFLVYVVKVVSLNVFDTPRSQTQNDGPQFEHSISLAH